VILVLLLLSTALGQEPSIDVLAAQNDMMSTVMKWLGGGVGGLTALSGGGLIAYKTWQRFAAWVERAAGSMERMGLAVEMIMDAFAKESSDDEPYVFHVEVTHTHRFEVPTDNGD